MQVASRERPSAAFGGRSGTERSDRVGIDSIFRTADVVGDAWAWLVMRESLLYGVTRFDEFHTRLGIARSTLAARLSQLIAGGLLTRQPGPQYLPSAAGEDFLGCLMVAKRWGDQWFFPLEAPPQPAIHLACHHQLHAVLRCNVCREVLTARDIAADRAGTVARPARESAGRRRRSPDLQLLERNRTCSIARTLTVTGDWWSGLIIRDCFFGTRRFDDFQRRLDIAPNILSGRLRRLVELDMLTRVEYQAWPTRHEYRLTDKGLDYYHVPLAMLTWGRNWLQPPAVDAHLTHAPCGSVLHARLGCASCPDVVANDNIALA
jgi:DNA-binding HxlR family transcriptional regulator